MADGTNHVISYIGDIRDIENKLKRLDRINRSISREFGKDFTQAVEVIDSRLTKLSSRQITLKGGRQATEQVEQFANTVRLADGRLGTLVQTTTRVDGAIKNTTTRFREGAKTARTFGDNLTTLLKRAVLTIPIWFAIRQGVGGMLRAFRDGLRDISDFDRALQKLRRNVSATSNDLENDFRNITEEIERFSIESGVSVQDITNAIQKFATVGFDVETSLQGGINATKLAVNLFGDASSTANAFARSLRILTADMESSEDQSRAIVEALALTDQLWQTNAFEVSEFSGNLEKFAGTAKIANLSIEDTLTLLATLSTAGLSNRGGRLIRSTILRALADFENINRELQLGLDPGQTPTIDFVLRLVDALKELRATENIPVNLSETLGDLFSVRSTEALAGLTALESVLRENIALIPDVQKFNDTFQEQTEQINRLNDRLSNVNRTIARTFVTGVVGGDDFRDSLETIVELLERAIPLAERLGQGLNVGFGILGTILRNRGDGILIIEDLIGQGIDGGFANAEQKARAGAERIAQGLKGGLEDAQIEQLISDLVTGEIDLPAGTTSRIVEILTEQLNTEKEITVEKEKQEGIEREIELSTKQTSEISETVLQNQLAILRAQGATASQITGAEIALRNQLGIQGSILDQVERQLQRERELTEEQRLRAELGNETIRLFRIAQTEGVGVAQSIGDVLSGEVDFSSFVRQGGQALEVFQRDFANLFEQQQALQFFRGDRVSGAPGLRGGRGIAIEEEAIRRRTTPFFDPTTAIAQRRAESLAQRIQADIRVNSQVQVNVVGLSANQISGQIKQDLIREMQDPNSNFSKQLDQNINNF